MFPRYESPSSGDAKTTPTALNVRIDHLLLKKQPRLFFELHWILAAILKTAKKLPVAGLISAAVIAIPQHSWADNDSFRFGIEAAYPPFAFKALNGSIVGFDYDIGSALCEEMKVKCVWVEQEFNGLIPALKIRKIDAILSSMSITDDRKKLVDFTDKYYITPARFIMRKGAVVGEDLVEVKDKIIGVQRGSIHERFARQVLEPMGAKIKSYSSQNEILLDMTANRVDTTLADAALLQGNFLKTKVGQNFEFVGPAISDPKYFGNGIGIAVRKGDSNSLAKLNLAIAAIRENGTYEKIQNKYFGFDIYGK